MAETELVTCAGCGGTNRVAMEKLQKGRAPVCARCKAPLHLGAGPLVVTDATFAEIVEQSPLLVLLDMWAPWCGPCRTVGPTIDELAKELAGKVRVGKMNVDDNPRTSERFAIRSIPALLVLRGGKEIDRLVGVQPKGEIVRHLKSAMG